MSGKGSTSVSKPRLSLSLKRRTSAPKTPSKRKRLGKEETIDLTQSSRQTFISSYFTSPKKNNVNSLNKTTIKSPQATGSCGSCLNSPSPSKPNDQRNGKVSCPSTSISDSSVDTTLLKKESLVDFNNDVNCTPLLDVEIIEVPKPLSLSSVPEFSAVFPPIKLEEVKDEVNEDKPELEISSRSSDFSVNEGASTSASIHLQNYTCSISNNHCPDKLEEITHSQCTKSLIDPPLHIRCPQESHELHNSPQRMSGIESNSVRTTADVIQTIRTPSKITVKRIEELTPKKTPVKGSPIKILTDGEKIKFSPKIKRTPGKYFDNQSMPEDLLKSPSKSQGSGKTTPQKKNGKSEEANEDPRQTKLDNYMTPKQNKSSTGDLEYVNLTPEEWKKVEDLINDKEAMENIRKSNAAKQLFPVSPSKEKKSETSFIQYLHYNPMIKVARNKQILNQDQSFIDMVSNFERLSFPCQQLYAKMFERTPTWYRVESDLVKRYQDTMGDVRGSVGVLIKNKLLDNDLMEVELLDLLKLLSVPELKVVFKHFNVEMRKGNSMKKENLIEALLNHACSQTIVSLTKSFSSSASTSLAQNIKLRVVKQLGECVCLRPQYRQMFNLLVIIATYPYHLDKENKRLSLLIERLNSLKFRKRSFPSYVFRPEIAFQDMKHLKDYAKALALVGEYSNFVESKDWDSAAKNVLEAKKEFISFLQDEDNIILLSKLGGHLLKFTAGYQYCFCLTDGITVLKKDDTLIDETVEVIRVLLNQDQYYRRKRGIWYDELANIYQNKKKDLVEACEVIKEGLKDESVDKIRKLLLKQRGTMLVKRKSKLVTDAMRAELTALMPSDSFVPQHHTITANCLEGVAGRKQVFYKNVEDGKEYSSVEEIVIHHYQNTFDPPYAFGLHDEGRTLMNIILGCFYDVIYSHPEGESMFHCEIQTHPLDWGGPHFYKRRQLLINEVLDELRLGGVDQIMTRLQTLTSLSEDVDSVVNWDYIRPTKLPKIKGLLDCLGVNVFVNIAEHVIKNYKAYHSGFPDLIVWDPPSLRCLLVEVKGPNDKLSITQTLWLENLMAFGANAVVCHVESQGSSKKKKIS